MTDPLKTADLWQRLVAEARTHRAVKNGENVAPGGRYTEGRYTLALELYCEAIGETTLADARRVAAIVSTVLDDEGNDINQEEAR